ncbi:MAG: helix-turn-helix transcriptional regulator [Chryseolinea sp.]
MKKYQLGEFEEIVMLTICILYQQAYGVSIKNEIEARLSRDVSMGALHSALIRLEEKNYIKSVDGDTSEGREGRPRRYFEITSLGQRALEHTKKSRGQLWNAIPKIAMKTKFSRL